MANFVRGLAKKEKLTPHLRRYFNKGEFPDEIPIVISANKEKDDAFHPSSDAATCLRAAFATRVGDLEREPIDGALHRIFHVGHMYHGWLQWVLVEGLGFSQWENIEREHRMSHGKVFSNDVDWRTDPEIEALRQAGSWWARGQADVAHCDIPGHGDYLIDIKTVNSFQFTTGLPEDRKAKYELQTQLYMDWHDVDHALILLAQKDSPHDFKEIVFERDPEVAAAIYERWDALAAALAEGTPPACDCIDPNKCPAKGLYARPRTRSGGSSTGLRAG